MKHVCSQILLTANLGFLVLTSCLSKIIIGPKDWDGIKPPGWGQVGQKNALLSERI